MRIKRKTSAMALASMGLLFAGCTTRLVDYTVISTKNIDWSRANSFQRAKGRTEGKDTAHIIIIIPTGVPNMKEAIDRAIESVPGGVALVDGVLSSNAWYIPYIYGQSSYVIEGSVLVDPQLAQVGTDEEYLVVRMDKDGSIKTRESISLEEYESTKSSVL